MARTETKTFDRALTRLWIDIESVELTNSQLLRLAGCLKGLGKDIISLRHAMLLGQLEERLKEWRRELAADMVRPDHAAEVKGATIDEATIAVNNFINSVRELPEFLKSGEAEMLTELKTDLEGRALEIAR